MKLYPMRLIVLLTGNTKRRMKMHNDHFNYLMDITSSNNSIFLWF